ncbi:Signal peptide peptidase-like 2A [Mortierella sp. AM989]|nr:Signal peptide peptidase-like 2A [Mortierella sp. AM989]
MKNIDSSLKTLDKEISADAKLMSAWGSAEGDDLADVCQRMSQLMEEVGLIQQAYSLRHTAYRKTIKSIKTQEMTLDENRKKKHDFTAQIAKLQKSSKENPIKLMELQSSLERVTAELMSQELELMQFKRTTIKEAFDAKFDAMLEYAEKMALIAGYGRAITFVIDTDTQVADRMRIYNGGEYTAAAVDQVKAAIVNWQPQPSNLPARSRTVMSQDELALSAAAAAYNSRTPPMSRNSYTANDGYSSGHNDGQGHASDGHASPRDHTSDHGHVSPPKDIHAEQLKIQEQQRQLEQEQQRLFQHNLASYSPGPSPDQQHYQVAAAGGNNNNGGVASGGFTPSAPQHSGTQEIYPPSLPVYESGSNAPSGYGGYNQQQYGQYDNSTYQGGSTPARNYRLGFVDPRERNQMDNDRYKAEYGQNGRPTITVLTLSTLASADTTVQERQEQRQKEESGEAVALTTYHALGFGFVASIGLLAMWMWSNVLGFIITLMLKVLKASSMSTPTLLLLTAFIYDVFFVFVTPYLTKSGESIMEAAATGAAMTVNETIPMLFRIPSYSSQGGEAMLGFGDVVLPGILITFLKECDARLEEDQTLEGLTSSVVTRSLPTPCSSSCSTSSCSRSCRKSWWKRRWSYHLTAILGYALGLEVTFVAMMWSNKGQPALLYLVPFTVLPVVLLASKRHELSLLWNGWEELECDRDMELEVESDEEKEEHLEIDDKQASTVFMQ